MEIKPIKVLHIDSVKEWRGGQQQVFYLICEMIKNGYDTALVGQPGSALEKKCRENDIPFSAIRMRNELDFIAGWKISRICKKRGFQILHAHSAHAMSIAIWSRLFHRRVKIVAARRVDFSVKKSKISIWKYKNSFVDKIICISETINRVLRADGIPAEKLVTIHSGINLNRFDTDLPDNNLREKWKIPANHLIVGTVAAIVGHKDYPNLLKAAKHVIEKNDRVTFMAVGAGKDENNVRALAAKLGLGDRFIFTGYQSDVGPFLRAFDFFIAASRKEGLGTSVLDALAVGLPVVGTRAGGIPESVQDGVNGLLVEKQNPEALATAILKLLASPKLLKEFSRQAPRSVEKFKIENTFKKTVELYSQLLAAYIF
ncbi:MAG: glycosyltransferase family 1 protein [Calditrichaeota bacterium]|nr:MAG: glycosyltransferase family 1 protein [Calditrichota bacterium]